MTDEERAHSVQLEIFCEEVNSIGNQQTVKRNALSG